MARTHTAGKEKHGDIAAGLASFACLFFFSSGIPEPENKESPIYIAELPLRIYGSQITNQNQNQN